MLFSQDFEQGRLSMTQTDFIETAGRCMGVTSRCPASPDGKARMEAESSGMWPYREAVGGLMWLVVMTGPDIGNAERAMARQSHIPTVRHWNAVVQIIQ